MTEMPPPRDLYERLSPLERNIQLRGLYHQLRLRTATSPTSISPGEELTRDELAERYEVAASELLRKGSFAHPARLKSNLQMLLSYAHITDTFKEDIRWTFDFFSSFGADRDQPNSLSDSELRLALDMGNPISSGIFDPQRAQQLERERFWEMRTTISERGFIGRERLERWRLDYWKKYKIDPRKR